VQPLCALFAANDKARVVAVAFIIQNASSLVSTFCQSVNP
jgi:hypothetical protein